MKLVDRSLYMEELKDLLHTPDIKVITGVRRCGKSKLLEALISYLLENDALAKRHSHQLQLDRI